MTDVDAHDRPNRVPPADPGLIRYRDLRDEVELGADARAVDLDEDVPMANPLDVVHVVDAELAEVDLEFPVPEIAPQASCPFSTLVAAQAYSLHLPFSVQSSLSFASVRI